MESLISRLEDLKTRLFDAESEILGSYGERTQGSDYQGNRTRELAQTRKDIELISAVITELNLGGM